MTKTEKLNELMNRISFALKDATLAQGFEIICKRIAELEKENKELRCCGNCQSVFDADGFCYLYKDGRCINQSEWTKRSNKKITK